MGNDIGWDRVVAVPVELRGYIYIAGKHNSATNGLSRKFGGREIKDY